MLPEGAHASLATCAQVVRAAPFWIDVLSRPVALKFLPGGLAGTLNSIDVKKLRTLPA
jgi:hypothetical protein